MQEEDRNRTQIEMQIECLNHKPVLSFYTEDLPVYMLSWKKQAKCREKLWHIMRLASLAFLLTNHFG